MAVTYQDGVYIGQMSPDDAWRQAMSEYEARAANPRFVAGQPYQADTPEALKQELFAPLQAYQEQLINNRRPLARALAERPYQFRSGANGEQTLFNPKTGVVQTLREARKPEMGVREKIDYNALQRNKTALLGKPFLLAEDLKQLREIEAQLSQSNSDQPQPASQPFAPTPNLGPTVPEKPSFAFAGESLDLGGGNTVPFGRNLFQPSASRTSSKVEIANRVSAEHPEWTKAQVIAEVNRLSQ